jgi:hypothetical protein
MRRISWAARPKKCARFCHFTFFWSTSREERFVNERGSLQRVTGRFLLHVVVSEPVQFLIHNRHQLIARGFISAAPGFE